MNTFLMILVAAAITFGLRFVPMLGIDRMKGHESVERLSSLMPGGIMIILVAYTLVDPNREGPLWTWLVAIAVTVAVHLWRRSPLITMLTGIGAYALLAALV